jgi:CubicO group peptidase (beta-lactamase class C family)
MGFGLPSPMVPLPNPNTIFWGGYGGSLVIIDMEARATMAYAMNRMARTTTGDTRAYGLALAVWQGLAG